MYQEQAEGQRLGNAAQWHFQRRQSQAPFDPMPRFGERQPQASPSGGSASIGHGRLPHVLDEETIRLASGDTARLIRIRNSAAERFKEPRIKDGTLLEGNRVAAHVEGDVFG